MSGGQAEAARPHDLDGDEIAILGVRGGAGRDRDLAAELLLVDRDQSPAAARQGAEDAEHPLPGAIDDLDDAAGMADRLVGLAGLLDAQAVRDR